MRHGRWRQNKSLSDLHKDQGGAVLIWFTTMAVLVFALLGLALEGGSLLNLHSQMQSIADSAALAGARELDGAKDALTRATTAAESVAGAQSNTPTWSDISLSGSSIKTITFYSAIKDGTNPSDVVTTQPKLAKYIQVETVARGVSVRFLAALGGLKSGQASAKATAKVDYVTCRPLQSFICNPFELGSTIHSPNIPAEPNPGSASNFGENVKIGQMMALVSGSGAPGNWGLLLPSSHKGSKNADGVEFWSAVAQNTCTVGSAGDLDLITGAVAKKVLTGINVRFDSPIGTGDQSTSAPIVVTGYKPDGNGYNCIRYWNGKSATTGPQNNRTNSVLPPGFDPASYQTTCNSSTNSTNYSCPLPRDRVFEKTYETSASFSSGFVWGQGSESADLDAYWKNHHPGTRPTVPTGEAPRWTIYKEEVNNSNLAWNTNGLEDAVPGKSPNSCDKSTISTPKDANRRLIDVAVVDCDYWKITGSSSSLPAVTLNAQFFITEPAFLTGSGSNILNVMGELVSVNTANSGSGAVHQVVSLVR